MTDFEASKKRSIRRFTMEYDPHVTCCCSMEEKLSGEYVLLEDFMSLLREYAEYRGRFTKPDNAVCYTEGCDNRAAMYQGSYAYCIACLQPRQGGSDVTT